MNITQEQKEFIENIIKECHDYKGNEYLLDEFCNEVIRRAYSLISKQSELDNIKVYIKRIANASIIEIIKSFSCSNKTANINYEIDDIELNYDISFEEVSYKQAALPKSKINQVKNIICNIHEENNLDFYKNIFELRYLKGLNNQEIAKKLEMEVSEVDKKLLFMLRKVKQEVFI